MTQYLRPSTIEQAVQLLSARDDLVVLAGGTDVYPARTARAAWGAFDRRAILDVSKLSELRGIEDRGDHWWIGALTTWSDIARALLPPVFDALKSAAREIGGVQIQNRGTIGGNLCTASPAADSIPCLLTLDAEVELAGAEQTIVPLSQFLRGYRKTVLGESRGLLTGVHIPKQSGVSVFRKLGTRRYLVISIAVIAGVVDLDADGRVRTARVAIGACSVTAQRLTSLEDALRGNRLDPTLVESHHFSNLEPIDDVRASAAYRRHAAMQLTRDAVAELASRTKLGGAHA